MAAVFRAQNGSLIGWEVDGGSPARYTTLAPVIGPAERPRARRAMFVSASRARARVSFRR